ncbi:MAG: twin-arginine translocation signal domain-containing protein, partial [Woeseiaceae bacterium]
MGTAGISRRQFLGTTLALGASAPAS